MRSSPRGGLLSCSSMDGGAFTFPPDSIQNAEDGPDQPLRRPPRGARAPSTRSAGRRTLHLPNIDTNLDSCRGGDRDTPFLTLPSPLMGDVSGCLSLSLYVCLYSDAANDLMS